MPVTKDRIRLLPGKIDYLGSTALLEFNIMGIRFLSKGADFVMVEITLQRRYFYHLATTYFPTFCLIIVTEMLLFINEEHFEAVIMVALTTMLVMYTLHQSISSQLPKTSYMKMIDIWLMFCLTVPFLVFVVEVLCETLRYRREKKEVKNRTRIHLDHPIGPGMNRRRSIFGKEKRSSSDTPRFDAKEQNSQEAGDRQLKANANLNDVEQHQIKLFATNDEKEKEKCSMFCKLFKSKKIFIPCLTIMFIMWYIIMAICI